MKKIIPTLFIALILLLSFSSFSTASAAESGGPVGLLQSIADRMIAALKANKATLKTNAGLVYSLANRIVVPHADLNEMSKRVLPPKTWNQATPSQRAQFQRQFTIILERTYASALAEYNDETVHFYPVRGGYQGKTDVKVDSQIVRNDGPSISVSYRLKYRGGQWWLYDMTVEGISMLESFRSQFADKLNQEDMASLIRDLAAHNASHGGNQ
jgi:phospholipid transport system substrate-binding protein